VRAEAPALDRAMALARERDEAIEQPLAELVLQPVRAASGRDLMLDLRQLLAQLVHDRHQVRPVEADPCRPVLQLDGAEQGGQSEGNPVELIIAEFLRTRLHERGMAVHNACGARCLEITLQEFATSAPQVSDLSPGQILTVATGSVPVLGSLARNLSEREREILSLVAEGLTNREIAERVHLAEKTVKHHMTNILGKLRVRSRVEAALLASRQKPQK